MNTIYPELVGEMAKRSYKKIEVAKIIGVSPRTLYSKLIGETDFTLSEANEIQRQLFPDMNKDDLFRRVGKLKVKEAKKDKLANEMR